MTRPIRFFETLFGFSELSGELEMGGTAGTRAGWVRAVEPSFTVSLNITDIKRQGLEFMSVPYG